jgi:sodium transport system permease protein
MMNRRAVRQALIVCRKELTDALRDRRALYALAFSALFGPVFSGFILGRVAERQRPVEDIRIPIVGMEHAPALVAWLGQQGGVDIAGGPADAEGAVRDRQEDVVVVILEDFAKDFSASRPAEVRIVSDSSRDATRPKVQRVRALLQRYGAEIGALRLVARGVSPGIATALAVRDVEVSNAQQRAARILDMLPLFVVMAAFVGGLQIAIDSTAGERERGSLEPLLANPAPRASIAAGKWMAATAFGMIAVILASMLSVWIMVRFVPLQELGIRFRLGPTQAAQLLSAVLPMCPLAASLQMYMATFARSFKEAQSYMGLLMLVPMLPGLIAAAYPIRSQFWMFPIPALGQHVLMADTLGGRPPAPLMFLLGGASVLGVALVLVAMTTRLLHREKIIFGR